MPEKSPLPVTERTRHLVPGQWDYARRPNKKELAKTSLLALARRPPG
jgi:uncharacterized protein